MASVIGTLGTVAIKTIGGTVFVDNGSNFSNLITLYAAVDSSHNCTFRASGSTSGYQVTSGKTLTIGAFTYCSESGSPGYLVPAQSDNDVGFNSATALTNPIYLAGGSSTLSSIRYVSATNAPVGLSVKWAVAATKYFSCINTFAATFALFAAGYEA